MYYEYKLSKPGMLVRASPEATGLTFDANYDSRVAKKTVVYFGYSTE